MDERARDAASAVNEETVLYIDNVTGEEHDNPEACVNGCHLIRGDENIKAARKEAVRTRAAYAERQKRATKTTAAAPATAAPADTKAAAKSENK